VSVTHQSGALDWPVVEARRQQLPASLAERYVAAPFFDDIAERIAASDLVIMRAGGSSLAECSALGRPMILVPYPHAGGHQRFNAEPFVRAGAALLLADERCTPDRLRRHVQSLIDDAARWHAMAEASRSMSVVDAADRVAKLALDVASPARPRAA